MRVLEQHTGMTAHQTLLLEMLKDIDIVCKRRRISYQLFAGTALGAVRHHGFIPWDDDVDIIMSRSEYERFFKEAAKDFDETLYFAQQEHSAHWPMPYSKLRRNNTTCIEKYYPKDLKTHQGVYVDIFPCDNLSDCTLMRKIQFCVSKIIIAKSLYARGYAAAYAAFFASLCTLGINSVIVKNFVDHPDQQGETIGTTLLLRAISSLLSALAIIGIVSVVDRGERLTIVVVALYSIGLIFQVFDTLNYWFQARLQSKYSAIAELVSYAAMSVYKIILLALGKSVEWFAVASALDYIVLAVFLLIAYFKNGGTRFRYSLEKAKELLQSSGSFIIAGLMVSIYACTDKLMLKQMLGADAVGHYSLASTVSVSWAFILSAIIDSLYPEIVQSFQKDRLRYERKNRQLYAIVFYVSLFVSAMICLVAKPFILILYGENYLPAVGPLRIVVWYTAFSYLGVARNAWMVCENRQKYLKYLYVSAAALNVVLNLALIPSWGASGAAAASLITQASTTVILPAIIRPLRPNCRLMLDAVLFRGIFPKKNESTARRNWR